MNIQATTDGIFDVAVGWFKGHKEISLLAIGGLITFVFTKLLPWMFQSGSKLGSRALAQCSSRYRRRVALGAYLNWVTIQNRDLNLTGIVGTEEKPQLEQVFISVQIQRTDPKAEPPLVVSSPQARPWAAEVFRRLKLSLAFLAPRPGRRYSGSSNEDGGFGIFSKYLFKRHAFPRLRRWVDHHEIYGGLAGLIVLGLVFVWPAWSTFIRRPPYEVGSGWAGLVWTAAAILGLFIMRENGGDGTIKAIGVVVATVFGGLVLAAIVVPFVRHAGTPAVLVAASCLSAVACFFFFNIAFSDAADKDTQDLGKLLRSNGLAILGKPGSGKSTLVQFFALTFSQAKAGERRLRRRGILRRRLGVKKWLMPIPIPLRKVASFVDSADPNLAGNLIVEAFRRNILPSGLRDECDSSFFLRMIAARRCLFLFDGLDEVSDDSQFQTLSREIVGLMSQYPGNKFVITSRYAGWRGGVGSSFDTFEVEDLTDLQTRRFIESWYSARKIAHTSRSSEARSPSVNTAPTERWSGPRTSSRRCRGIPAYGRSLQIPYCCRSSVSSTLRGLFRTSG